MTQAHLDERQDFATISLHDEYPTSSSTSFQPRETEAKATHNEAVPQQNDAVDKTNICLVKRKAILLLSKAHKSENASDRRMATSLLAALYKAETEQDLAKIQLEIAQLLQRKQQQDNDAAAIKSMEFNETSERFSRFRATWNRFLNPSPTGASPLNSSKRPLFMRNQEIAENATRWKMFWQSEPISEHNEDRYGSRFSQPSLGLDGMEAYSVSRRLAQLRSASKNFASNGLDTRTV